jgi:hypothetical protein
VLPFPDCSVTALSSVVSVPTDLRLSLVSSARDQASLCEDAFFLKQVKKAKLFICEHLAKIRCANRHMKLSHISERAMGGYWIS